MGLLDAPALSLAAGNARYSPKLVAKTAPALADVLAIPNLKWCFTPETGFYSDQTATTRQTTDGGSVLLWKDAGPNADHAKTATAGLTFKQGGAGGADALNVNAVAVKLGTTGTFDSTFDAGFTTFTVASDPTLNTNRVAWASADNRLYHARNGSNGTGADIMTVYSKTDPPIPPEVRWSGNTVAPLPGMAVEAWRYNGPSTQANTWIAGTHKPLAQTASATAAGITGTLQVGGFGSSTGFQWGGLIQAVIIFNRALTNAEVATVYGYLAYACNVHEKPLIQCVGNSLSAGTGSSTGVTTVPKVGQADYPSRLLEMFPGQDVLVKADAYPGRTNTAIISELPLNVQPFYTPGGGKRIALVWEVTNDLATNILTETTAILAGQTPTSYTNMVTICQTLRSQGWTVGVFTCLPRGDMATGTQNAQFFKAYHVVNKLIRRNWGAFADFIVDVAADPRLGAIGAEQSTVYFHTDKVHLNDEGYRLVASVARRAIDPLIESGATATTYLAKSVAGAANVTLTTIEGGTILKPEGNGIVALTGAITANINVVLPLRAGAQALFVNNTTGAFTVTLIGATGTGYTITQGKKARAYSDGTNWFQGSSEI